MPQIPYKASVKRILRFILPTPIALSQPIDYKGDTHFARSEVEQSAYPAIQLKRRHRKAKTKWEADRLKAVYLLGEGWEPHTVAHILDTWSTET